jgi:hypothetical protein
MSEQQKSASERSLSSERIEASLSVLSPLVVEALRARGLSDDAINAVMRNRRKPKA